jgi:predicted phage gp36 major capsid-like protein
MYLDGTIGSRRSLNGAAGTGGNKYRGPAECRAAISKDEYSAGNAGYFTAGRGLPATAEAAAAAA